ncbi:MAG: hypothetical protein KC731_36035, partial [Myxococcales bacterium]|nr:hypothetical protein [Myxococcales bacterium]
VSAAAAEHMSKAAKCQSQRAMHLWALFHANLSGPRMNVVPDYTASSSALTAAERDDWESMFGRLTLCRCEHCRSVYSAAAYLVDMLQFLDGFDSEVPNITAKEYLIGNGGSYLGRRPDIRHIALSCENTNTTLPYVDLVNELLERHVAGAAIPTPIQTDASSAELLATPQILAPSTFTAAYDLLSGETSPIVYPWSLPYSLWQHQARIYLEHLGTTRAQLMELLQRRFAPGDVPGCVLWLRADVGVSQAEGRVTKWRDLSGRGYALVPVEGELGPFHRPAGGSNDQPHVHFAGSELLHVRDEDAPALDLSEEVTVVVITSDLGPSDAWVLSKGASGPGHHYGVAVQSGNLTAIYDGTTQMGPSWGAGGGTAKISVTTLSTERTEWRVDGVEAAVDATHTIVENDQPLYLGARATGAAPASFSDHLAGRVYEILVYDGALRPSDVAALEAYAHERYGAALTPTTGNTPSSLAIAQERLGMSAAERALIVANPSSAPWAHWGFASSAGTTGTGDWSADLTLVGTFLAQSDIGYDELRELLDGRFMLDWAASPGVQPTLGVVPGTSGCHVDEQRIVGLGSSTLPSTWNAVQRFLRLRRRLGWEIRELDKVLTALTGGGHALDDALVASLGDVVALTEHPRLRRVPRAELAAYWADLDTQPTPSLDEPSFFDSVYRSKALSNPAIFDVVEGGRIDDHLDDVLAGLVTTATELRLLIDGEQARRHLELLPAVADRRVTLSNLSRLYRIVAFARRLRRPISEILVMQALTGINALTGDAATPATPATPRDTRAFLAELDAVAEIGMRIPELHYLLRHVIQPGTGVTGEIAITESRLHQLDLALEKVVAETAYAPDPDGAAFVELLTTELTRRATELSLADAAAVTAMAQAVVRVLDGTSEDTPEDQKQLLRDVFGSLIADIEAFVSRVVFEPATDLATCALWLDAEDIVADQARRLITWPSKVGTHTARPPKPTDLPGCTLWLRATADDVTTSSGARIDTWSDRAGTNHATQLGDDTHKPTFGETSGYGGQPGIELDGSDDWLDIPGLANPGNDHTVLVVLHQRAIDATQHLLSANTQGTDELNLAAVVSAADPSVGFDDEVDTRSVASAKLGDQILTWVFDATAGTGTVYRDGSPIGAGPAAYGGESLSAGSVALGRTNDTSGGYFAGAISEVVVFNRALPPDELRYLHGAILAHYARGSSITGDGPFELKALQLSGDDDLVIIDAPGFTFTSQTVVAVVRQDALPDDAAAVPLLEASTGRTFAARTMGTTKPGFYDGSSWFSIGADEDASVGDRILTWVIDDDVDQVTLYRNGAAVDGASSVVSGAMLGNLGLGGMGLGALGFGSDVATFPGAIALLGVFDTHLSDADLARVHHHLYQRTRDARRYEHAHQALLDEVRRTTSRNTVVDTLSTALDLPAESTEGLVHRWLTAVSDPNQPLIADLLPATHTTTEAAATTRFQAMVRLDKAARIVHALDLDAADIEALQGEDRDPRWLRLDELPVTSRAVARFDIDQTAVRDGRVSLPSWLSLTCETEGRTTQVGPSTVVSGLPAHAARAMSRDGVIWGLLVEPATTNAIGASNHDLNNWQDSGSPSVATAVGPDGVAGPLRLTDESTTLAEGKYLALGPFGGGTFSLWIHDEGGHARAFLREGVGGATLSANLDGPSSGWALLSDSADYGASDLTVFLQPRGAGMEDDMGSSEFALVQLEAGSYPTSFIQATRAAEVLVADLASLEGVMRDGYFDVTLTYAPLYAHDEATTKHDLLFIDETHRILYSYSAMAFL